MRSIPSTLAKQAPKLLIALIVVSTLSAFADSAEAARTKRGNKYNQTDFNETFIENQFTLFDTDQDGNLILDSEPTNPDLGFFSGAIEDFTPGEGSLSEVRGSFVYFNPIPGGKINKADLRAEVSPSNFSGNAPVIKYSILDQRDGALLAGFSIDYNDNPRAELPSSFDPNQAINNLTYILENDLLGLVDLSADGFSLDEDTQRIVDGSASFDSPVFPEAEPEPEPVPEPMTGMVLASGVGGAFMFWKRRRNTKAAKTAVAE